MLGGVAQTGEASSPGLAVRVGAAPRLHPCRAVGSVGVGAAWLPTGQACSCLCSEHPPSSSIPLWGCRLPQPWCLHKPMGSCLWLNPQEAGPF